MSKSNFSDLNNPIEQFEPEYLVTLDEIYHSRWAAWKRQRIRLLHDAISYFWPKGHPSQLIHVTGTNGKGSVVYYLEQALQFAGNTGSWTGPHVFDYAERFHLNTQTVSHQEIVEIYKTILLPYQEKLGWYRQGESLSFAELGILIALHLFERHQVKWGIMEVGAGGRYTPLMALDMKACILTNIGEDHPVTLGSEPWQRALEKSGIARPNIPFFTGAEEPILSFVKKCAEVEGAPVFSIKQKDISSVEAVIGHQPEYRLRNIALTVKIVKHFYPKFQLKKEIITAELPARFWKISPNIIADVSHNPDKIQRLAEQLKFSYPSKRFRFILGLSRNRDVKKVFSPILELADHIVLTSASYAGQDPIQLSTILSENFKAIEVIEEPKEAFRIEKERLQKHQILVLTGSAYMIDQALNPNPYLRHMNATFGRRSLNENRI